MSGFEHVPPVLDLPGVAALLGIPIEEARRLTGEGWIPSTTLAGRPRYRRDEVLAWLRSQRVKPPDQDGDGVVG